MQYAILIILLLTAPTIKAQQPATPSSEVIDQTTQSATKSATQSAESVSTKSAIKQEPATNSATNQEPDLIQSATLETGLIYTGIMTLILIAFFAGKKSSDIEKTNKS